MNDAPTLAPLALCLVGVAGIYRTGRTREYVLAGVALGVAIATKYTAGIVLVTVVAAAFASPVAHARVRNLAFAVALMCAGFVAANPYALLDRHTFWDGIQKQTETAGEERRQARPGQLDRAGRTTSARSRGASAGCRRCSRSAASAG